MKQRFLRFLADLRFAIAILLVIAFFSIIGTVIEQDQSIEVYKLNYPLTNKVFGFLSWDIILKFGFDHVYKTWWFISCIVTFGLSLFSCTVLQQFPALKVARRCQFFRVSDQFKKLKIYTRLQTSKFHKLLFKIKQSNYSVFHQRNIIYAYKGLIGRIAPIVVHFSMILILIGTLQLLGSKIKVISCVCGTKFNIMRSSEFTLKSTLAVLLFGLKVWFWLDQESKTQPTLAALVKLTLAPSTKLCE